MERAAFIWAVVFAVLAIAIAFVTPTQQPASAAPDQVSILAVRPTDIQRITLERDASRAELVQANAGWDVVTPDGAWPAESGVAAGVVRLLTSTLGTPASDDSFTAGVTLIVDAGTESLKIEVSERALGGTTLVRTDDGVFRVGDEWQRIFVASGAAPWRSKRVLPTIERGVRAMELITGGQRLRLERAGSGWAVKAPVVERARSESAEALLAVLAGLESEGDAAVARSEAEATIVVEQQPAGDDEIRWRLDLSPGGTVEGSLLGAVAARRGEEVLYNRPGVRVSADLLARLTLDPAAYVQRVALNASSADVLSIRVGDEAGVRRPSGGWAGSVADAIAAMTGEAAADVVIGELSGDAPTTTLSLEGLGGVVLGALQVLEDTDAVWLGQRGVWRKYEGASRDAIRGLLATLTDADAGADSEAAAEE